MSERGDNDELLLPDDAEQRIQEMLDALSESEAPANSDLPVEDEALAGGDEEADFVDLDAEILDNSADVLQLDEQDSIEERLIEEMEAETQSAGMASLHQDLPLPEERPIPRAHQRFDSETMAARFRDLEQELMRRQAASLRVLLPASRPRDSVPVWLTPLLALLALVMSGGALWFALNPSPPPTTPATEVSQSALLQGMKAELVALRERLAAAEKQAEEGKEAVVILERMQQIVDRMAQKLLTGDAVAESGVPSDSTEVEATRQGDVVAEPEGGVGDKAPTATNETAAASGAAAQEVGASGEKVFIKGWAVNLGSYYYRSDAQRLLRRYLKAGIAAEIREIPKGSVTWYRIRVKGFESKGAAQAFINGLTIEQGREEAWPSYYEGYVEG